MTGTGRKQKRPPAVPKPAAGTSASRRRLETDAEPDVALPPALPAEADPEAPAFIIHTFPGHLVRRLQQVAVSLFLDEVDAAGSDLTPVQFAALTAIETYPGIDQASLAGLIAYDRTTIGGVVDRLEAKGLVTRRTSKSDRRVRQLVIEPAGEALLERLADPITRAQDRMLDPLTAAERAIFMLLLTKLLDANNAQSRAPMRPFKPRTPAAADPSGPKRRARATGPT